MIDPGPRINDGCCGWTFSSRVRICRAGRCDFALSGTERKSVMHESLAARRELVRAVAAQRVTHCTAAQFDTACNATYRGRIEHIDVRERIAAFSGSRTPAGVRTTRCGVERLLNQGFGISADDAFSLRRSCSEFSLSLDGSGWHAWNRSDACSLAPRKRNQNLKSRELYAESKKIK